MMGHYTLWKKTIAARLTGELNLHDGSDPTFSVHGGIRYEQRRGAPAPGVTRSGARPASITFLPPS